MGLPKRVLAWRVIQRLCQTGHTPEWIAAQLGTGVEQVFVQAAGELDAEQMIEAVGEQRRRDGRPFEPHRFFMQDDQLIRSKGVTYAVIGNIWGRGSEVKLKQLCAVAPEAGLSISIASRE